MIPIQILEVLFIEYFFVYNDLFVKSFYISIMVQSPQFPWIVLFIVFDFILFHFSILLFNFLSIWFYPHFSSKKLLLLKLPFIFTLFLFFYFITVGRLKTWCSLLQTFLTTWFFCIYWKNKSYQSYWQNLTSSRNTVTTLYFLLKEKYFLQT